MAERKQPDGSRCDWGWYWLLFCASVASVTMVDSCMVLTLNINITWTHIERKRPKSPLSQCVFKCRNSIHIILHKDIVNQSFNVYSNRELLAFWKHYLISTCPSLGSSYFPQDDFLLVTPSPWFWFLSLAVTQYTVLSHPKAPSINIWDQFSSCLSAPCTHS